MGNRCSRRTRGEQAAEPWSQQHIDRFVAAAGRHRVDEVKGMLADVQWVPEVDAMHSEFKMNALMMASARGFADLAKVLLMEGAEPELEDWRGWTPVMYAARYGRTRAMEVLLDYEAEVDVKDIHGWTPLMVAAAYGREDAVRTLLDNEADELARNGAGSTALQIADEFSQDACADLLSKAVERARKAATAGTDSRSQRKLRKMSLFAKPGKPGRTLQHVYSGITALRRQSMRRQVSTSTESGTGNGPASTGRSPSPPVWARVPGLLRKASSRGGTPASMSSGSSADESPERAQPATGGGVGAMSAEDSSSSDSG